LISESISNFVESSVYSIVTFAVGILVAYFLQKYGFLCYLGMRELGDISAVFCQPILGQDIFRHPTFADINFISVSGY
jgi:hypothetical protein